MNGPTEFIHLRRVDSRGNVASRGGFTIAYSVDPEDYKISMAYAKCNKKDNFNKRVGRQIAEARLKGDCPSYSIKFMADDPTAKEIFSRRESIQNTCIGLMLNVVTDPKAYEDLIEILV